MKKNNHALITWGIIGLICLLGTGAVWGQYTPRAYYGAKFEPVGKVLHSAGQPYSDPMGNLAFENYGNLLGPDRYPIIFMAYTSVTSSSSRYIDLRDRLDGIQATTNRYVVPQIGFYFPSEGMPTSDWDATLLQMCDNLKLIGRPIFMRMGYEFNGTWYDPMYQPDSYKAWFRRLTDVMREQDVPAATAWCAYPGYSAYYGSWDYLKDFYPGDDYVDWWSIDVFAPGNLTSPLTLDFLDKAEQYAKPVLIGEATPTGVGAEDASDWTKWFQPFFNLINTRPGIKAHAYINYDWSLYTGLSTWGDARLETADPYVRSRYIMEMGSPLYMHATDTIPDEFLPGCNAANADADADGVGDTCDICPGTIPGATVDGRGCPPIINCDFNNDGDVDQEDFGRFQACLTGPAVPVGDPKCQAANLDGDVDVDQDDLIVFQQCISGPNVPADPNCAG
ncbi:MAG: glycosyl hydrolase [Planctomycetota bacterium]|jgi:hypothetical protein